MSNEVYNKRIEGDDNDNEKGAKMKTVNKITSNQYYAGLNRRFDKRAKLLIRFGFLANYNEYGGFYEKPSHYNLHKKIMVSNYLIMHADKRAWLDFLRSVLIGG